MNVLNSRKHMTQASISIWIRRSNLIQPLSVDLADSSRLFASSWPLVPSFIVRRLLVDGLRICRYRARLLPGVICGLCLRLFNHFRTDFTQITFIVYPLPSASVITSRSPDITRCC